MLPNSYKYWEALRAVALTQTQLLNAWRRKVIDEPTLREQLSIKGLDNKEIDIIIETKRQQWRL